MSGKLGPFEIKDKSCSAKPVPTPQLHLVRKSRQGGIQSCAAVAVADEPQEEQHALAVPPQRSYDCEHYDTCLGLAAALDWNSFTCSGCRGCVNTQLLWRAHHEVRRNRELEKLCELPQLSRKRKPRSAGTANLSIVQSLVVA